MDPLLRFKKIGKRQNILYDEFFLKESVIDFICFNYDNRGSALCLCDGELRKLDLDRVNKILFGVETTRLDVFIQGLYRYDIVSADLVRANNEIQFRLEELQKLDKYEIGNMAKKIRKQLLGLGVDRFHYFTKQTEAVRRPEEQKSKAGTVAGKSSTLFGNVNSRIFHRQSCKSFNSTSCTVEFRNREEAVATGYRPCKQCDGK